MSALQESLYPHLMFVFVFGDEARMYQTRVGVILGDFKKKRLQLEGLRVTRVLCAGCRTWSPAQGVMQGKSLTRGCCVGLPPQQMERPDGLLLHHSLW